MVYALSASLYHVLLSRYPSLFQDFRLSDDCRVFDAANDPFRVLLWQRRIRDGAKASWIFIGTI